MSADLIARLEAATSPDRQLDNAVAEWAGLRPPETDTAGCPLHYTGSIDAALTLIPHDALWEIREARNRRGFFAVLWSQGDLGVPAIADGHTAAIAICIARLRLAKRRAAR